MNLAYFKSYLAVVKKGGFSEAAKALGLSQPTVSFQIQRLEEEVAAKLLERHGGKVVMTPAGREFEAFAERVLQEKSALEERLAALHDDVAGTLSLGASTHPGEYILPRIIGQFRQRYPKVSATIVISDTAEIVERVLDRQCDAALVGAEVKRRGLEVRRIGEDPLLLIAPPGHPLAGRASVSLAELEPQDYVFRTGGSGTQRTADELLHAAGLNPARLRHAMVAGSNQAVITAVEAGVGLAFVSRMAAARSLELKRVVIVPVPDMRGWVRGIYYVRPTKPVETRLLREFGAFVEAWRG